MIDVWSKKGIVLLNISPMADGTIPEEQRNVLAAIGQWAEKHQEAIYGTRTYSTFGYGKAGFQKGEFGGQAATMEYDQNDIRFTISKDKKYLYVFALGPPAADSKMEIQHINDSKIKRVSVVGSGVELKWSIANDVLTLTTPGSSDMNEIATVFKVEFE
jgi:alpha-L-fucosidase